MAISDLKMETWTKIYDPATAKAAHKQVREVLQTHMRSEVYCDIHTFLQGSYRNQTSIFQDSDVDLVVRYDGLCDYDFDGLDFNDQIRAMAKVPNNRTGYSHTHVRQEVSEALVAGFGASQVDLTHKKSIKVKGIPGERFHADVIPCIQYRRYKEWTGDLSSEFVPGIALWPTDTSRRIVNYPEQHIENGSIKNKLTRELFKPTVRLYKNMRNVAVEKGLLERGLAPSYFIECLLWNVDPDHFFSTARTSFGMTGLWLQNNLDEYFKCQNDQLLLFDRTGTVLEQWSMYKAEIFLKALFKLWERGV